jgi:hypothetical protein
MADPGLRWSWLGLCAGVQVLFAAQLAYNLRRWQREEIARQLG